MASKRRLRRVSCGTKRRFDTPELAENAKYKLLRQKGYTRMNVYRCQFCHKYHIGHTPAIVTKAQSERKFT